MKHTNGQEHIDIFTTGARSKPRRRKRLTSADNRRLIGEAELYARLDWMKRAHQVEFLAELEGRPLAERNHIHRIIRRAKEDVAFKWGDPGVHSGEATMSAIRDAKGDDACVALWSDLDWIMKTRIRRMKAQREERRDRTVRSHDDDNLEAQEI